MEIAGAQNSPEIESEMLQRKSWVSLDVQGGKHFGYDAAVVVFAALPLLRPISGLLGLGLTRWCGERLYRCVASHRQTSCEVANGLMSEPRTFGKRHLVGSVILPVAIATVIGLNLSTVRGFGITLPEIVRAPSNLAGLDQIWNMFAPFPAKDDARYVMPGRLRNGRTVDLFRGGKAVSFKKPAYVSLEFMNHRWRKFLELMRKRAPLPQVYAGYLCRDWNRRHRGGEVLEELEVI